MRRAALSAALLLPAVLALSSCGSATPAVPAGLISVVAAEDQYGSIAAAIGGKYVYVTSLLSNPNTDPHEFEASAVTARTVSSARLVIENGLGYDAWLDKLLGASPNSGRRVINAGSILGRTAGDNPHVWYMPSAWPVIARAIAGSLSALDSRHRAYYGAREAAWVRSLQPVEREIQRLRRRTTGKTVIASEVAVGRR